MGNKQVTIGNRTVALEKQIGEGGQAFIYAVRDVSTGDRFALKRVCFREAAELSDIEREVSFHRRLGGHQHVVPLHGHTSHEPAGSSPGEVLMLMDFMPSNAEILCGRDPPESRILDVFSQVVEAVAFMHSQTPPIAHRDLKVRLLCCCFFFSQRTSLSIRSKTSSCRRMACVRSAISGVQRLRRWNRMQGVRRRQNSKVTFPATRPLSVVPRKWSTSTCGCPSPRRSTSGHSVASCIASVSARRRSVRLR